MKISCPFKRPVGRLLRVLLYARYSTQEQNRSSIDDQFRACRKFLGEWGIEDAEIQEVSDHEMSGELRNRPGIDQVRIGIQNRCWDLILGEDSSRLFRNPAACSELVGDAVDRGIRVILPGDNIDTEDEDWPNDLNDAQAHHSRSNSYTRKRIKRKHDGLWETKAALGLLKPGYLRRPTRPATEWAPAQGPFYDAIDVRWQPIIHEAYERIARLEPPWLVAKWLTEAGLPKSGNAKRQEWSDRNVVELIRRKVYKGVEEFRKTVAKKVHGNGKSKQERNPAKALEREMEHLRMVEDDLWDRANAAIDQRAPNHDTSRGLDHPLAGIPRDSRGPLSNVFFCVCGGKMHGIGRKAGGYRCQDAKNGPCWNRATTYRKLAHEQIAGRVVAELLAANGYLDVLSRHIERLFADDEPRKQRIRELMREIREDAEKRDRVLDAIENAESDHPSLLARLQQRDEKLRRSQAELASLQREITVTQQLPSRDQIEQRIRSQASRLLEMDREAGTTLQRLLDGPILAVPYLQFGSNKIVLRAEFKLRIIGLLPDDLFHLLQQMKVQAQDFPVEVRTIVVDLFVPSGVPQHAREAWAMRRAGKSVKEICLALKITKRIAHQAVALGKKMQEVGLTDPFIRITERPASASRWGARKKRGSSNDDRNVGDSLPDQPEAA